MLIWSAIFNSGFFSNANTNRQGASPRKVNKKIAGIRKFGKGESFIIDNGMPSSSPDGEIINTPPPNMAPTPRNANRPMRIFLKKVDFMTGYNLRLIKLCQGR